MRDAGQFLPKRDCPAQSGTVGLSVDYGRHLAKYGDKYSQWDPGNRSGAQQVLSLSLCRVSELASCVSIIIYHICLASLSSYNIEPSMQAYTMVMEVKNAYPKECQNMVDAFKVVFQQCQRMGEAVGSPITMPHITA